MVSVEDSAVVKVGGQTFLVSGFNDGALCLLDLSARKGQSYRKPVFKTDKARDADEVDNPYSQFTETSFEHADTMVSVDANRDDPTLLLSASKDGAVFVWRL
jgi:WD40 repeat protein